MQRRGIGGPDERAEDREQDPDAAGGRVDPGAGQVTEAQVTDRIDPKKDPARRCLKVEAWPALDREAWQIALRQGDIFDERKAGDGWKASTRGKVAKAYGRWLNWLQSSGLPDSALRPSERVTLPNVGRFIADLQAAGNSPYTVLGRIRDLFHAMRALAPEENWDWLRRLINRLRRRVMPVRNKRILVVPSDLLLAFGLELMTGAEGPEDGSEFARASHYRNGLMIALLAARPLRRRNFASIEIGRHLVKEGDQYLLCFEGEETKTGVPIEDLVPAGLNRYLERYLSHHRPVLASRTHLRNGRHRQFRPAEMSLWISTNCSAMSEGAIYEQIRKLTRGKFGRALTPHLFRDSAATSIATEDPEHIYTVKSVLAHGSLQTSEKHYNHANSMISSRRYQSFLMALRRQSHDADSGDPPPNNMA
jgi:hypothetical protein